MKPDLRWLRYAAKSTIVVDDNNAQDVINH